MVFRRQGALPLTLSQVSIIFSGYPFFVVVGLRPGHSSSFGFVPADGLACHFEGCFLPLLYGLFAIFEHCNTIGDIPYIIS